MGPDNLVTRFARNNDSSNPYLFLAKCGSGFIDIRPKMSFDIHRALWYCKDSRGAHKTASDCKMTFCDNVMLLTAGGDFYE